MSENKYSDLTVLFVGELDAISHEVTYLGANLISVATPEMAFEKLRNKDQPIPDVIIVQDATFTHHGFAEKLLRQTQSSAGNVKDAYVIVVASTFAISEDLRIDERINLLSVHNTLQAINAAIQKGLDIALAKKAENPGPVVADGTIEGVSRSADSQTP